MKEIAVSPTLSIETKALLIWTAHFQNCAFLFQKMEKTFKIGIILSFIVMTKTSVLPRLTTLRADSPPLGHWVGEQVLL